MDRLEAMSIVLVAAEAGSLSAAARRLNTPQATASRKITELSMSRPQGFDGSVADGRNRRVSRIAAPSGDGLLSEPKAGTQPRRQEPLLMPLSGPNYRIISYCIFWNR